MTKHRVLICAYALSTVLCITVGVLSALRGNPTLACMAAVLFVPEARYIFHRWPKSAYILSAIACGAAYPFGRAVMVRQGPEGFVSTSGFTLNYLLLFVLTGAVSPWVASRLPFLRRFKKATASGLVMITLVSVLLIILTLAEMPMRWNQ